MMRLAHKTRVLVADGAHALVFRNDGDAQAPNLKLVRGYEQDNPATHDQGSDRPGRTNDSMGRRSAMETPDWHRIAEDRFMQRLADDMKRDLTNGEFEKLIVAVPPIALGEYRRAACEAVSKSTILEIDKDLTKHPVPEIEKLVVKALEEASGRR